MEQEVKNAYNLFSKFDVNLPMPDFSPAPPGFRHDPKHMDFRNALKFTGKFNPNKDDQQKCFGSKLFITAKENTLPKLITCQFRNIQCTALQSQISCP
jgi:hypothetical protein